jgi:hypothetical protein
MTGKPTPALSPSRITTIAEGEESIRHLADVMGSLLRILEKETEVVRAGRLSEAAALEPGKAELARSYLSAVERVKRNAGFLRENLPESLAVLSRQHDNFYAILQINLTVLATAQAVAEGLVRGAAEQLASKTQPRIYGQSGRPSAKSGGAPGPVAVSRKL